MAEKQQKVNVPKRILRTLLTALTSGVVPRSGAPYIAIGRSAETAALLDSLDAAGEGGASTRFLIGRYGSGKSFLLQLLRGYALDRDYLTADVDLSPERRLSGSGGLATYRELLRNLASRAAPEGGALPLVLSRYYASLASELAAQGIFPESPLFGEEMKKKIYAMLSQLEGGVGGFEFARVLGAYYAAEAEGDDLKKSACLRWLRGEFHTKTEARSALGFPVGCVIDDANWYDYIKLVASLSRRIGYRGLLVLFDECVNLYKIPNRIAREANYEKILSLFNDTIGGRAEGLALVFAGTVQFLEDTRRGLFGYEALRSRLADSRFTSGGYTAMTSPLIRLRRLSDNELLALIQRLSLLHAELYGLTPLSPEKCEAFLRASLARTVADEQLTPREMIRDFLALLDILRENSEASFEGLVQEMLPPSAEGGEGDMPPSSEEAGGFFFNISL